MSKRVLVYISMLAMVLAAALIVGCGSGGGSSPRSSPLDGSVVAFGGDAPLCNVESFVVTMTSAALVPQAGGTPVSLITSANPATVDFARLVDFTDILSTASVPPGTYDQLNLTIASPQLITLNTSTSPPSAQSVAVTLTATTFDIPISPALVVTSSTTSGLLVDLNLVQSVQVNGAGQATGTVNPQFTVSAPAVAGTTVGEADALYGTVGTPSSTNLPSGFTGSFPLTLADGTGQTLMILVNQNTVLEGDGVATFADLMANTFVEVDALINTSGQIIAQTIDAEEQVSAGSEKSAFLGRVTGVTRDASGNATSMTLLVEDEIPEMNATIPLYSSLTVTLTSTTSYFSNWQNWNPQAFAFGAPTLGVAENVAVYGTLGTGSPPPMTATQVFLRPRNVLGNFRTVIGTAANGKAGGFSMTPCGALFAGQPITVLTYANTNFTGINGLNGLTAAPTIDTNGVLFYLQTAGTSQTGINWIGPTWLMQARGVHQLPAN